MPTRTWMRAPRSTPAYGPATATAGGVTVTATAHVATIRWDTGDGTTATCNGPGTPYTADRGTSSSPDCGHRYTQTSAGRPDDRYQGTATATWTVTWTAPASALGDGGTLTETRQTALTAAVSEVQVLNRNCPGYSWPVSAGLLLEAAVATSCPSITRR
ncbi:ATP/GTP-binding protein [Streptomyces sp. NPDC002403]